MKEGKIVQLLLLVLLALAGGNTESLKDVRPMLENLGGGETLRAIEQAERLASAFAAARGAGGGSQPQNSRPRSGCEKGARQGKPDLSQSDFNNAGNPDFDNSGYVSPADFPLAPIADIADGEIKTRLSRYIAVGE